MAYNVVNKKAKEKNLYNINKKVIIWWENELTFEERDKIMGNKSWSDIGENNEGGIIKRHIWLLKQYKKYHK